MARRYLLRNFGDLREKYGINILFVFGPLHRASYNRPSIINGARSLKAEKERDCLKDLLAEFSLPFCDTTDSFIENYKLSGKRFDFLYDGHANKHAHKVLGIAIANDLLQKGWVR